MSKQKTLPLWRRDASCDRLVEHHQVHCQGIDAACWQDVLGVTQPVTVGEYEAATNEAFANSLLQYEAEEKDGKHGGFHPLRHYRVDGRSLKVVAGLERDPGPRRYHTCYHVHYGGQHDPEMVKEGRFDQIYRYMQNVGDKINRRCLTHGKFEHGPSAPKASELRLWLELARRIQELNKLSRNRQIND